jgi:hypothetical protein
VSRTHECPGGCGRRDVPRHRYACRECWYRLPDPHRRAIQQNHRHHSVGHAVAMHEAHTWFVEHPLNTEDSRTAEGAHQR